MPHGHEEEAVQFQDEGGRERGNIMQKAKPTGYAEVIKPSVTGCFFYTKGTGVPNACCMKVGIFIKLGLHS